MHRAKNGPTRHSPGSRSTLRQRSIGFDGEGECSSTSDARRRGWGKLAKMPHTPPTSFALRALLGLTSLPAGAGCKVGVSAYASSIVFCRDRSYGELAAPTPQNKISRPRENPSSKPPAGHAPRKCSRETVVPLTGALLHTNGWIRQPLAPCSSPQVRMRPSPRLEAGAGDDHSHVSSSTQPPLRRSNVDREPGRWIRRDPAAG